MRTQRTTGGGGTVSVDQSFGVGCYAANYSSNHIIPTQDQQEIRSSSKNMSSNESTVRNSVVASLYQNEQQMFGINRQPPPKIVDHQPCSKMSNLSQKLAAKVRTQQRVEISQFTNGLALMPTKGNNDFSDAPLERSRAQHAFGEKSSSVYSPNYKPNMVNSNSRF